MHMLCKLVCCVDIQIIPMMKGAKQPPRCNAWAQERTGGAKKSLDLYRWADCRGTRHLQCAAHLLCEAQQLGQGPCTPAALSFTCTF